MNEEENSKPFVVKDRRRFDAQGNARTPADEESASSSPQAVKPQAAKPQPAPTARANPQAAPQPSAAPKEEYEALDGGAGINFSEFVLSLATNAVIHLGGDPGDGRVAPRVNLQLAAQHIDIIGMLGTKTRGNLTPDEIELLDSILYDLRMKYVSVAQSQSQGRGR